MGTITKSIGTAVGSVGTGTVTAVGTTAVVGIGTLFNTEMKDGSGFPLTFKVGATLYQVASITDDTHLTLLTSTPTFTNSAYTRGSRNYSLLQSWEDALPANLVTDANSQVGECYNDTEFTHAAGSVLIISGETTSSTFTITLTTGSGQSFRDNANVQSNALFYNQTNGVGISGTYNYGAACVTVSVANVFIKNLQIKYQIGLIGPVISSLGNYRNCILDGGDTRTSANDVTFLFSSAFNCLFIERGNTAGAESITSGANVVNCTIVNVGGAARLVNLTQYVSGTIFKNCAFFGFNQIFSVNHATLNFDHCITDLGSWGTTGVAGTLTDGGGTILSKTFSSQFVSTTVDFRLKAGSDCLNVAVTDTTDITTADDIAGTSRPQGSAWDIGCWELVVASGSPRHGDMNFMGF